MMHEVDIQRIFDLEQQLEELRETCVSGHHEIEFVSNALDSLVTGEPQERSESVITDDVPPAQRGVSVFELSSYEGC